MVSCISQYTILCKPINWKIETNNVEVNKQMEEKISEVDVSKKVDEVQKSFSEFKENVSDLVEGLNVDVNNWNFSMEGKKDKMIIDLAVKLVITTGNKGEKTDNE